MCVCSCTKGYVLLPAEYGACCEYVHVSLWRCQCILKTLGFHFRDAIVNVNILIQRNKNSISTVFETFLPTIHYSFKPQNKGYPFPRRISIPLKRVSFVEFSVLFLQYGGVAECSFNTVFNKPAKAYAMLEKKHSFPCNKRLLFQRHSVHLKHYLFQETNPAWSLGQFATYAVNLGKCAACLWRSQLVIQMCTLFASKGVLYLLESHLVWKEHWQFLTEIQPVNLKSISARNLLVWKNTNLLVWKNTILYCQRDYILKSWKDNWTLYMKRPKQNCNFKEQLFKHENCIFERTLLLQMHSIHSSLNTVFWKKWSMSVNVFFKNCVSWEEYRACQRTPPYVV